MSSRTPSPRGTRRVPTYCYQCVAGPDLLTVKVEGGVATEVEPNFGAAGIHPAGGKVCVNACIADALAFGDLEDPRSNVSRLLAENRHFRMHQELGNGPGFFHLWDRPEQSGATAAEAAAAALTTRTVDRAVP
jgi:hypothetical protein